MFTVTQIKIAHAKVKSGVDFPNYIREIKQLGVTGYKTFVNDSHTEYYGKDNYTTVSQPMYDTLVVADNCSKEQFMHYLKITSRAKQIMLPFAGIVRKPVWHTGSYRLKHLPVRITIKPIMNYWLKKYRNRFFASSIFHTIFI